MTSLAKPLLCWNCGHDVSAEPLPLSRHSSCDGCGEMLHCCHFCTAYKPGESGDCTNDQADPPNDKSVANFCEYFTLNENAFKGAGSGHENSHDNPNDNPNDNPKAKLDSLFGEDTSSTEDKGNPLDDLFND